MLATLDVSETADFEPRHRSPFRRLADQLAVQERDHVDGIVEADAKLAAVSPGDLPCGALSGREFHGNAVAERWNQVTGNGHAERRDFSDLAFAPHPGMIDRRRVERPLRGRCRSIVRPGGTISRADA